ncbi:MAG TPA: GIY-YIG nuclease family protein [Methanothermobacter sp.]|nr:GIY-YIG nuclease family protein [Methanothermobacter sp.]
MEKLSYFNVGSLGRVKIESGCYVYVGSAFKSLEARIRRHLSRDKKIHWHIDYLLTQSYVRVEDVIFTADERRLECLISKALENPGSIEGFGCSDCNCKSHLHYYKDIEAAKNAVLNVMGELGAEIMFLKDLNL